MKRALETRLRETRRLQILTLLQALEPPSLDARTLASSLRDMDMEVPPEVLDAEIVWLDRVGLVEATDGPLGKRIRLTDRGDRHVRGVTVEPGVARPAGG